jgi:adenylate cyclase
LFVFENDGVEHSGGLNSGTQMLHTVALPMKTVRATLLVGDLRNFTSISAQLTPEEVAEMLREWYAQCTTVLKTRGAIIDKFIGDGVFAYWTGDSAEVRAQAVEAARLLSSPESSDLPVRNRLKKEMNLEIHCHVGINIGDVALGSMGRGVNTAVGEAVNVAFRIEGLTRHLKVPVLVIAAFIEGWDEGAAHFKNAGVHSVKGHPDPIEVFALV